MSANNLSNPYFHPLPLLIGDMLAYLVFGVLLIQIYIYRICFPRDSLAIKILVYFVFLADAICVLSDTFTVVGIASGPTDFLNSRHFKFLSVTTPFFGAFIVVFVQFFYCFRIVALRKTARPIAVLIGLIAMAQFSAAMGWLILDSMGNSAHHTLFFYLYHVGGASADVLIAVTMAILLLNGSSLPQTRNVTQKIALLIVETNALTTVLALVSLLLFVCAPGTDYYLSSVTFLVGIYANTLLVMLNERAEMRFTSTNTVFTSSTSDSV
ncbi:hypothetical protein B0H16DRAFT_1786614 [Mycena metata]|uniref:DUF6534 domain-containing protein n=1 Tax=Mycena metata TaxID=1033252 RepID=A0AAD7MNC7_9AGAR|nr:hypothetical protein B0H16DRAFT_1786614 [Mycena metata]